MIINKKAITIITILIIIAVIATGAIYISDETPLQQDKDLHIAVSIPPQEEIAKELGGDNVAITTMVPEGEDPHIYEPTIERLQEVSDADIYFKIGSGLEFEVNHMDTIKEQNEDMKIVDGSDGINLIPMHEDGCPHDHDHGHEEINHENNHENGLSEHDIDPACLHMLQDEREILEIGLEKEEATIFTETHQPYKVELTNEKGYISFEVDEAGEYAYFTDEKDVLTPIDGVEKHHEENIDICEEISEYYVLELEEGENKIELTGEETTNITILAESVDLDEEHDEHMDPHVWLSPPNAEIMTENLLEAMIEEDPDNSDYYQQNADEYLMEIEKVDEKISSGLENYSNEKFMIYHPSMGYFADEYNLTQIPIEEEGEDPGTQELQNIIDQAKEEGINTIFVSPQFDQQAAEAIAEDIDGEVITLNPLDDDYLENLIDIYEVLEENFEE